ncbi:MAG TPA: DNA-formamidopyrimidine glycosylase family protein [Myxococcota bacterium]
MPELPDIETYLGALERRVVGQRLQRVRLQSVSLLRSVDPPLAEFAGLLATGVRRLGKRVVLGFEGERFLVIHLMIAGRLRWRPLGAKLQRRYAHAGFDFANGTLLLTEAGTQKRATLHCVRGEAALALHDPGGIDVLACGAAEFAAALTRERHTLKRALTDPHVFSGIGNAYSDEILHTDRLSPVQMTTNLDADELARLYAAVQTTLRDWTERLRAQAGDAFPEEVTAFRPEMAVHGKYRQPCPVCGAPVQRILHAENETNYCARCQTGGRVLADRALSQLLRKDWPRTLEELEARRPSMRAAREAGAESQRASRSVRRSASTSRTSRKPVE